MTLCLLDSLSDGLDYKDIMEKFKSWLTEGEYTPYGEVFDVGIATREAISRYMTGIEPSQCGGVGEHGIDEMNKAIEQSDSLMIVLYGQVYRAKYNGIVEKVDDNQSTPLKYLENFHM